MFLQGGPGHKAGRPAEKGGWVGAAVDAGFRVLLLDQRGTGRSTAASLGFLQRLGGPDKQAEYLKDFRADAIVADCEAIREALGVERWSVLGQSFGGFCATRYLSAAPAGVREALLTGGLPPGVGEACAADRAYARLFKRVEAQNRKFYRRFPGDVAAVQAVVRHLVERGGSVPLPKGGVLTPRGLQLLGFHFGMHGGLEHVHFLLEEAFDADGELSHAFLSGFEDLGFDTAPLFLLLHEAIYCSGGASNWAAQRVRETTPEIAALFDAERAVEEGRPVYFTGEMIFPWMFDELSLFAPLKECAEILASTAWPPLYDTAALARCDVPVAAASYLDDMYVDYDLAQETAALIGSDGGREVRQLITNEYTHSGLRENGAKFFKDLLAYARDETPVR